MAEVIGCVSSIITLLGLAEEVSTFIREVKDSVGERKRIQDEIDAVRNILSSLKILIELPGEAYLLTTKSLGFPLTNLRTILARLALLLRPGVGLDKAVRAVKWPFQKEEAREILDGIERLKTLFILALQNDQVALTLAIRSQVAEIESGNSALLATTTVIQGNVESLKLQAHNDKEIKILEWLSTFQSGKKHTDVRTRRLDDTGQWLLAKEEFHSWRDDQQSKNLLWCHGIPGAGKTVLSSLVIDELKESATGLDRGVAFFYYDYRDQQNQTPANVIASILKQLAAFRSPLPNSIVDFHNHFERQRDSIQLKDLEAALSRLAGEFRQTFIVIDALDECEGGRHRGSILGILRGLQRSGVKIFATSRPHPTDIIQALEIFPQITIKASESDIRRYLVNTINRDSAAADIIDEPLKEHIVEVITAAAKGMFLLPALQIETILMEPTKKKMRLKLKQLSKGLEDTFGETMERIKRQSPSVAELGLATLMWIFYARRPLLVWELQEALAVSLGDTYLDKDDYPVPKHMVDYCLGLLTIDKESSTIRLVHFTIQEYFVKQQKEVFPLGQDVITKTCLTYLSFDAFGEGPCAVDNLNTRLRQYPLLNYVAEYWGHHGRESQIEDGALDFTFLSNRSKFLCCLQANPHNDWQYNGSDGHRCETILHAATFFGWAQLVRLLVVGNDAEVDSKDRRDRTPLSWAAGNGHEKVMKMLLEHDAEPDSKDQWDRTSLSWAAENGHEKVVKMLLEHDAEPDSKDQWDQTPLSHAAENGHEKVMKMLLEHDAESDSKDQWSRTPLSRAAQSGHEKVMKMLLEHDAKPDSKNQWGQTPLSFVAEKGHEKVVKMLLEHDAESDSKDQQGRTPLSHAAENGHEKVMKMLLEHNAEPDSRDQWGRTPLSRAAQNGHEKVVKMLLKLDAESDSKNQRGRTPLSWAAEKGHEKVVKMLLEHDAESDSKDQQGRTPLSHAAENGHEKVMKMLLEHNAEPDSKDQQGWTPLSWAAQNGHEKVVKMLLKYGAELNCKDESGRTPLMIAWKWNDKEIVKVLLDNGARFDL
ncbi:MAG: hypothetical protein M1827_004860 [Pycnora praestabilis]|nr:MAG: hypothetical protein M1827_004860 [Pycnora praestabilis]